MTGGAVKNTCEAVREKVLEIGRRKNGSYHPAWATAELLLEGGKVVTDGGEVLATLADVLESEDPIDLELEFRHRPTVPFDLVTGQGDGHVQYTFAAHRAVVEWTPSSASSRSSSSPPPRTWARRSTCSPSSARSRVAPPRAWASR